MEFVEKTAVITGASRGIGREIAYRFAREGAHVVFNYAGNEEAAAQTEKLCRDAGAKVIAVRGDVSSEEDCKALFAAANEAFGRVDILVNNAGITRDGLAARMSEEDFSRVLDVNLKGTFYCMKAAARLMSRQKYGRIISMSSVVGLHGNAGQLNYSASKAGVIGMTKSLAKELASRGVTVNAVAPGFVETDMTAVLPAQVKEAMQQSIPLVRLGTPSDIAAAVLFLASEGASYITGQVLSVDGGMSI